MDIKPLAADLAVSGQARPQDMAAIRDAGFRAVICNRPDGEGSDQPGFQEVAAAARKAGLEGVYLPILSGKVTAAPEPYPDAR